MTESACTIFEMRRASAPRQSSQSLGSKDPNVDVGPSAVLEGLKPIKIRELELEKVHYGRVLYGRLSAKASKQFAILTALEDDAGNEVLVSIHDAVAVAASHEAVDVLSPMGMKVGVMETLYETSLNGDVLVRVDYPPDIICLSNSEEIDERPKWGVAESLEALESYRKEGNKFFQRREWDLALAMYLRCILQGNDVGMTLKAEDGMVTEYNTCMMLTLSNMAEVELRLGKFEDALSDVEKALQIDPTQLKSLSRQGRAAMELGLYKRASAGFKAFLAKCPDEASVRQKLRLCTERLAQSQ